MKIIVIANCQVQPIVRGLSALSEVEKVIGVPLHFYGTKNFENAESDLASAEREGGFKVLAFGSGPSFGNYAFNAIKDRFDNVIKITNIYFSGLHPDITYLGDRIGRLQSPIGDYHSKIIVTSYLNGLTPSECRREFNGYNYENLGYFNEFESSAKEMLIRDRENEVAFGGCFLDMTRKKPCLYTMNHPTAEVFQEYNAMIAKYLGLGFFRSPVEFLPNYLSYSTWWPVYPEVAEANQLLYRMPMQFKKPDSMGGKFLSLDRFIDESYAQYSRCSERLKSTRQVLQGEFNRDK